MKLEGSDVFCERAKALEDSYIAQKDRELIEKLKNKITAEEAEKLLISATGVEDHIILKELQDVSTPHFLAVLAIFPIVKVAWSDGVMQDAELKAVLSAANKLGIASDSKSHLILDEWLKIPPDDHSEKLWFNYVNAICKTLKPETVAKLEQGILGRAKEIALASGGILGLGNKISNEEQACLENLAKAFCV